MFNIDTDDFVVSFVDFEAADNNKDLLTMRWIRPSGRSSDLSTEVSGDNSCWWSWFDILDLIPDKAVDAPLTLGRWTVQLFKNASQISEKHFTLEHSGFKITQHPVIDEIDQSFIFCNPPEEGDKRNSFVNTDKLVGIYVAWHNLDTPSVLRIDWVRPDNQLHQSSTIDMTFFDGCINDFIEIKGAPAANFPGQWQINVFKDGGFLFTDVFTLLQIATPTPAPTPGSTPTPASIFTPTPTPIPTLVPTPRPTATPPPSGKSFTFECDQETSRGKFNLETLELEIGDKVSCVATLTNEAHDPVRFLVETRGGMRRAAMISPDEIASDKDGEAHFTIQAVRKGIDWVAWGVPNEDGEIKFDKKAYDNGLAWGMFVKVK